MKNNPENSYQLIPRNAFRPFCDNGIIATMSHPYTGLSYGFTAYIVSSSVDNFALKGYTKFEELTILVESFPLTCFKSIHSQKFKKCESCAAFEAKY